MSETTNLQAVEPKKKYELRKLEAKDIAPMASILSKIGMRELKNCFNPDDLQAMVSGKDANEAAAAVGITVAFDLAGVIMGNYEKCQNDIFKFLSSLSEMDIKEVESLSIDTFTEMVIDVIRKEEFTDFIKVVSKLFK